MQLSSSRGAFVASSGAQNKKCFSVGMPLGISLTVENDRAAQPTRISVCEGAKFALSSVAIKAPSFGPYDQVMLMARFIGGSAAEEGNEWICLSNFLGKEKGGQAVPNSSPFNLEAVGPCVVELSARGSLDGGSVEVVGNLVASDGVSPAGLQAASLKGESKVSSKGRFFKGLIKSLRAQAIFVVLMVLCLAQRGGGGFARSTPSLHPTNNRNLIQAERVVGGRQNRILKSASVTWEASNSNPSDFVSTEEVLTWKEMEDVDRNPDFLVPIPQATFEAKEGEAIASFHGMPGHSTDEDSSLVKTITDSIPEVQQNAVKAQQQGEVAGSAVGATLLLTDGNAADLSQVAPNARVTSQSRSLSEECFNLTIGILPVDFYNGFVEWWLDAITDDGNETVWGRSYDDLNLKGTIILEHAREESVCLPPGTYGFYHNQGDMAYAISSEGVLVECGLWNPGPGIFVLPFNSSDPSTTSYSKREDVWYVDDGGLDYCPIVTCTADEGDDACVKKALEPLQCWYNGRNDFGGEPTEWLTNACSVIFTNACEAKSLGLDDDYIGFRHNIGEVQPMCPFFECAIPAYQSYLKGGTLEEYHGCNCQYAQGQCAGCTDAKCCFGDSPETTSSESDIVKSCDCVIEPNCEIGDVEMCEISLDFCCPSKLDEEKNACEKTALHGMLLRCEMGDGNMCMISLDLCSSIKLDLEEKNACEKTALYVILSLCEKGDAEMCDTSLDLCSSMKLDLEQKNACEKVWQVTCESSVKTNSTKVDYKEVCKGESDEKCSDEEDSVGCKCSYWETLCTENIWHGSICEEAVVICCDYLTVDFPDDKPGFVPLYTSRTSRQCHCDFYNYVSKFGYMSEKKQSSCDDAFAERKGRNNMFIYEYYLKKVYESLGGESWFDNTGWEDDETPFCKWFGIDCDQNGFVSRIQLKGNNLNGSLTYEDDSGDTLFLFNHLYELEVLDLSDNYISGQASKQDYFNLVNLRHVDLSGNELTGAADILLSPSIRYLNYSHNIFSSVGHVNRNYAAYESLEVIDLSENNLNQSASAILQDLPPNLKSLYISNNLITGTLPQNFPIVTRMEHFHASNNLLRGPLIEFSRSMPRIFTIDLSNQKHSESGGLDGSLSKDIPSLLDLLELKLSGNTLTNTIPADIGDIPSLRLLNLSNNDLSGEIPSKLGQLAAVSKVLDLSSNAFKGTIPQEINAFSGFVYFDNNQLSGTAPLDLCYIDGFDLKNRSEFCSPERNALKDFFLSTKGQEWSRYSSWGDPMEHPCNWYGVECDERKSVVGLKLANNGLGGLLSSSIGDLSSLKTLDISDNGVKGSIPKELFKLSKLTSLRLSYNQFSGTVPVQLAELTNLELAQFHSNWLMGDIYLNSHLLKDPSLFKDHPSSFTSDCGVPSAFDKPANCTNCTMCCNLLGVCHTTEMPAILNKDTWPNDYVQFGVVLLLSIFVVFAILVSATYFANTHFRTSGTRSFTRSVTRELIEQEKKHAMKTIGHKTVYWFFLTRYWAAWVIALSVIAFQFVVFGFFVVGAEKSFDDKKVDFVYSWRCPRNNPECENEDDTTAWGWVIFGVLMFVFLWKDVVNGSKLVSMSTKAWHHRHRRIRFFFGGISLILITTFAVFASTVYNYAIARSNRELVINAVIVLFISDIDEQMYSLIEAMCPEWLDNLKADGKDQSDEMLETVNHRGSDIEQTNVEESTDQGGPQNRESTDFDAKLQKLHAKLEQMELELKSLRQAHRDENVMDQSDEMPEKVIL